jgi:HTH-type transcriptional regulator/antitoxin HipB
MKIESTEDFGVLIKRVRNAQKLTQPELAGASGVGVRFIVDLEKGKPTCQIEKALLVAQILGIHFIAQEPSDINEKTVVTNVRIHNSLKC